ncbi:MAG: 3'-5' exoribonuclease [Saprospiraceae bacterium]|nr:3'-5' exoribonuclease [Saprospiraceae bacterium]
MKIFLDMEFTGLHQATTLISMGLVAENGREFYAEFNDFDRNQLNPWLEEHVLPKLEYKEVEEILENSGTTFKMKGNKIQIRKELETWLSEFDFIEIWADVLAYDWVLFCELFGGAMNIPSNIFFAPFDLATYFRLKGIIEPMDRFTKDVSRFEFAGADKAKQHHALIDSQIELVCFKKLHNFKTNG